MDPSYTESPSPFPPAWADTLLRAILGIDNSQTISGDLLEEYRATLYPARGRTGADYWFVKQVAGFIWRVIWIWAVAFAALQLGRDLLDWLMPPVDYRMRSLITTYAAMCLFIALGCRRGWRTRSVRASALAAGLTGVVAAAAKVVGVLVAVSIRNNSAFQAAIESSGGFDESIMLPWLIIFPATLIASAAGLVGKAAALLQRARQSSS